MAFDHPLEADKFDDSGLFSTFVRAPVVGVIMWALGGDEAKKREEEEQRKREVKEQLEGEAESTTSSEDKPVPSMQLQQMIAHNRNKKMGKKMPPRMIGSDLSDFGDLAIASESKFCDTDDECDCGDGGGLRRTKKMSWSDESGKDLCEVINETSVLHEPQHTASASQAASQPKKTLLIKRTRSTVLRDSGTLNKLDHDPTLRFLPKGINPGHGGIIYPTNPNAQSAGYISPEGWGWYITTTPPTPDMYHHHSSKQSKKSVTHSSATAKRPSVLTNPAFKAGAHKTAMGWPSVPL